MNRDEKVFVTGGTGFIGTRLVQALVDAGLSVRVLSRRRDLEPPVGFDGPRDGPLSHPAVELVPGDVTDRDCLIRGMRGCTRVFHIAGLAKNWAPNPLAFFAVNVQGMRNVFHAAAQLASASRLDLKHRHAWSDPQRPGRRRKHAANRERFFTEYERTKTIAEREALARAQDGFPVVIVNPTRVFGPGHLTEGNAVSQLIDDYDRGRVPVLLNAGMNVGNYVFVEDVVQGHILAMEKGRPGERYILGGDNVTLRAFFRLVDKASGKRHLQVPVFCVAALTFAWWQKVQAEQRGVPPRITPGWMRTFLTDWAASSDKARRELGYRPTPLDAAVRTTYRWLQRVREEQPCASPIAARPDGRLPRQAAQADRDPAGHARAVDDVEILRLAPVLLAHLAGRQEAWQDPTAAAAAYSFLAALFLLGVVPAVLVKLVFRERLVDYGVGLGDRVRTLRSFLLLRPAHGCRRLAGLAKPRHGRRIPDQQKRRQRAGAFASHALVYAALYLGWEFYFRGFMQFGLRESLGDANALLVQVACSVLVHIGKPATEVYAAIGGGILWGILASAPARSFQACCSISSWAWRSTGSSRSAEKPEGATVGLSSVFSTAGQASSGTPHVVVDPGNR